MISAEGPLQHGLQPTCVIFDELWVQKKRDLFEALAGGLFKRPQTLLVCISTAGFDPNSLLAQECKRGEAGEDPRFLYRWEQAPEALPYDDPETWRIANPALRCDRPFMRLEGLEDDLRRMHENEFRRWHLNQWTASEATWITAEVWDACAGAPTLKPGADRDRRRRLDPPRRHSCGHGPARLRRRLSRRVSDLGAQTRSGRAAGGGREPHPHPGRALRALRGAVRPAVLQPL